MKTLLFSFIYLVFGVCGFAQTVYKTDVSNAPTAVKRGHLDMGGKGLNGETISANSFYIERNGKAFFPVIGEFHFCRFPQQYWDEQIKKAKAGGINIIATYVFWNMHEAKEGTFNWAGNLNLRYFLELCKNNGIDAIVRIGPFAHGEIRNGGLPDWLYGRPFEVRSNDEGYLFYVERLYGEIAKQLQGLYFQDGGPVVGIQIENEYQHSAAPWAISYTGAEREYTVARFDRKITQIGVGVNEMGNDYGEYGQKHMQTLKALVKKVGLNAPLYTATGWGYATIVKNGTLPVSSGYAYPFWEESVRPSPLYLYKNIQKNPDYSPVSYNVDDYPSLAAELGTGMSVVYGRRPRVPAESFLPLMVRTVGSGTNGLGYYMYQGGNTPSAGLISYTEGWGLNSKTYDYQAPIREFGNVGEGFFPLKVINTFLKNFGDKLAPLYPVIPETNAAITPTDTTTLRYSVRSNGESGFVFMHNFQDHVKTCDLKNLQLHLKTKTETISFPQTGTFTLKAGTSAILPFNLKINEVELKQASVQPLCQFANAGQNYVVFVSFEGISPEFVFKSEEKVKGTDVKISTQNGKTTVTFAGGKTTEFKAGATTFIVLPFEKALKAYLVGTSGKQYLLISDAVVLENGDVLDLISMGKENFSVEVFPKCTITSENAKTSPEKTQKGNSVLWNISTEKINPEISLVQTDDRHYVLKADKLDLTKLHDVFVNFDYRGDRAVCMLEGEMATDNFYTSQPWTIGLKRYAEQLKKNEMYFYFIPMLKNAPYISYLDKNVVPDFSKAKEFLEIKAPSITPEYLVKVKIGD